MKVTKIWRYPVKTMAGEELERGRLGPLGIDGDRVAHIEDSEGRLITSRSHPRFLGHKGSLGSGCVEAQRILLRSRGRERMMSANQRLLGSTFISR